jgi:adenylate cyclase, class 2
MYEIEAKVAINRKDFERLSGKLKKEAGFKEKSIKKDIYFNNAGDASVRIREKDKKSYFDIKDKGIRNGTEVNIEMEWGIKDVKKWVALLGKIGIRPGIRKIKRTEAYRMNGFDIELNYVAGLGYFLEIERIVKSKTDIPEAKKELIEMFNELGYSQKDFEKKYYLELLQERHK